VLGAAVRDIPPGYHTNGPYRLPLGGAKGPDVGHSVLTYRSR
jgi:hypothetical protein